MYEFCDISLGNYQQGDENLQLDQKLDEIKIEMDEEGDEEEGKVTASNNTTVRIYNSTTVCVCT